MPRKSTPKRERERPSPVAVGRVRAYPRRPPTASDPRWYWQIVVHQDGGQESIPGASGRYTEAEALQAAAALVAEHGLLIPTERPAVLEVVVLGDLLRLWLAEQAQRADRGTIAPGTYRGYARAAVQWREQAGEIPLAQLRERRTLQRLVDALTLSPRTARVRVGVLRAAWRWGLEEGHCPGPLPRAELRPVRGEERAYSHHTPTAAEAWRVLRALPEGWERLVLELCLATGARVGEIASLPWARVSLERAEVRVVGKTGGRTIPLQPWAVDRLRAERAARPAAAELCPWARSSTLSRTRHVRRVLDRALHELGATPWSPHALRRLRSWEMIAAHTDAATYREVMGHSLQMGLSDYASATPAARRAAVESSSAPPPVQSPCTPEESED